MGRRWSAPLGWPSQRVRIMRIGLSDERIASVGAQEVEHEMRRSRETYAQCTPRTHIVGARLQTTKNDFVSVDGVAREVCRLRVASNHGSNAVRSAGQGCW